PPPTSTLFPYTTLFRSGRLPAQARTQRKARTRAAPCRTHLAEPARQSRRIGAHRAQARTDLRTPRRAAALDSGQRDLLLPRGSEDRKSTRLNSSHVKTS